MTNEQKLVLVMIDQKAIELFCLIQKATTLGLAVAVDVCHKDENGPCVTMQVV